MNAKIQKTERIISVATQLFSELGFEQTSMQKIADDAEIGVATLFRYFPKKELLIVAVIEHVIEEMVPLFSSIGQSNRSGLEKMEAIIDAYINYLVSAKRAPVILLENFDYYAAYHRLEPALIQQIQQSYAKIGKLINESINEGISDGSITLSKNETVHATVIMNLFGTAIKKHSFNMLLDTGIFPIPSESELKAIKALILCYLTKSTKK